MLSSKASEDSGFGLGTKPLSISLNRFLTGGSKVLGVTGRIAPLPSPRISLSFALSDLLSSCRLGTVNGVLGAIISPLGPTCSSFDTRVTRDTVVFGVVDGALAVNFPVLKALRNSGSAICWFVKS